MISGRMELIIDRTEAILIVVPIVTASKQNYVTRKKALRRL